MSFKILEAPEAHGMELALFDLPPIDTAIQSKEFIDYRPVAQISPGATLEFNVSGQTTDYIDLNTTRLALKLRITKDNKPIDQTSNVGLINIPLQSIFRQCDLSLNQQIISTSGTNYPYKAYFDILLNYSDPSKQTQLTSQLFYKDTAGQMDDADSKAGMNEGLLLRSAYTEQGKIIDLEGPLYLDICQQKRYLLNGIQINLKLWPHLNSFHFMSNAENADFTLEIVDAILKVCSVKVTPNVQIAHNDVLKDHEALYPFDRTILKTFSIPKGYYDFTLDDIFQGTIPYKLIIGLVSSEAYSGSYTKNPFNFKHYNCNFAGFYLNGQSVPARPFKMDYTKKNFIEAYLSLFTGYDKYMKDQSNAITRDEYAAGYCLYVFNIHSGSQELNKIPLIQRGHTRLNLKFGSALPENVTIIIYSFFPGLMKVDQARNIIIS